MSKPTLRTIKITDVRENPVALRAVDRDSEAFIGLRDSIKLKGILNPINVREKTETVEGTIITFYELCDGLHRYTAAVDVGISELNVQILTLDDAEVLEAQIMANVHRIDMKPVQYTQQMNRIFAGNPTMTVTDMAVKLAKSPSWVSQRLGLLKLEKSIAELVDAGKINVSNAVVLAKLPHAEQVNFVDSAMTLGADEFAPQVQARAKELRDAARQGRAPGAVTFEPTARIQKMPDLLSELKSPTIGPAICAQNKAKTAEQGFALGVQWAVKMDPASVEVQRALAEEKAQKLAEAKAKRAADRADKKATEAAEAKAKAQADLQKVSK
ncbi:MAG: ParB/RepB/Spo0J family partition protein [Nitrosomonadaceae bacterium]